MLTFQNILWPNLNKVYPRHLVTEKQASHSKQQKNHNQKQFPNPRNHPKQKQNKNHEVCLFQEMLRKKRVTASTNKPLKDEKWKYKKFLSIK